MEDIYPRRFMVDPSKGNIWELQFERFPVLSSFHYWKTNFKTEACPGSGHPKKAMPWIKGVEMANTVGDQKTSRSIYGRIYPNFETLDARNATSLKKINLDLN